MLFDNFFTTVKGIEMAKSPDLDQFNWPEFITTHGTEKYFDETDNSVVLQDTWGSTSAPQHQRENEPTGRGIDVDVLPRDITPAELQSTDRNQLPLEQASEPEEEMILGDDDSVSDVAMPTYIGSEPLPDKLFQTTPDTNDPVPIRSGQLP